MNSKGLDYKRRLKGLQERMQEQDIDLAVYGSCQNFQYLTGLLIDWRHGTDLGSGRSNLFVPAHGRPILTLDNSAEQAPNTWVKDVRVSEMGGDYGAPIKKIVSDLEVKCRRVGIGDHVWGSTIVEILKATKGADLCKAERLMDSLRMIKDDGEIDRLRKAAKLTDWVMEATIPKIKRNVTQRELALEVESQGRRLGASDVSFPPTVGFVKSGSEISFNPFTYPKEKGLVQHTSIAFDIGFVVDGYCSDFGRSFYYGHARKEVKKGYEALQQSVLETVDKMWAGSMRVCDLFPTIETSLDRLGYGDYLRARLAAKNLGHNVGVEVHEPPWLSPQYNENLCEGMVIALEPKLWHAGQYYLRVEDIVLVGSKKTVFLTNFDRELFQLE